MNINELFIEANELPEQLSDIEFNELLCKMIQGDNVSYEKLITHNIRFVLYEIKKFNYYDKKELVSVGIIGLINALRTYDVSRQVKFATYASRCINNQIKMFLRKVNRDKIVDSLDKIIYYDEIDNIEEVKLSDSLINNENVEDKCIKKDTHKIIREIITSLPYRDSEIIKMHFGFYNNIKFTQKEIAQKLNITQSYVSKIIYKNVKNIGCALEKEGIIELNNKKTLKIN